MSSSKSFGVRMPLEMYLKMVTICTKNGISQTDLVLHSLNRVGLFTDNFKLGGEVEEKIVYRNEPELLEEINRLRQNTNGYFKQWQEQIKKNEESPNTDYLFANLEKQNTFEKSMKKMELMNSMNFTKSDK
jgi:hypothetical protein